MEKNILELKVNNKVKNLESYLKPQWSWKTLISVVLFCSILVFIVKDLEIDFIKLVSDSSKYFGDILSRMLPPDFSNLNDVNEEIIFKNEIGRIRDIQIHPSTGKIYLLSKDALWIMQKS